MSFITVNDNYKYQIIIEYVYTKGSICNVSLKLNYDI